MLTPKQLKLYKFLKEYKKQKEVMPTFEDMKTYMIEWKGYIKREPAMARAITILKEVA